MGDSVCYRYNSTALCEISSVVVFSSLKQLTLVITRLYLVLYFKPGMEISKPSAVKFMTRVS